MVKTTWIYGLSVAAAAFALRWLEYQHSVRLFATEIYIVTVAVVFTVLGIWVGHRISSRKPAEDFKVNTRALDYLGVSKREWEVLRLLAEGHTNKEIGESLFVSPNTVKTHLAHLYDKLEVSRRTQAVRKAKSLRLIP